MVAAVAGAWATIRRSPFFFLLPSLTSSVGSSSLCATRKKNLESQGTKREKLTQKLKNTEFAALAQKRKRSWIQSFETRKIAIEFH